MLKRILFFIFLLLSCGLAQAQQTDTPKEAQAPGLGIESPEVSEPQSSFSDGLEIYFFPKDKPQYFSTPAEFKPDGTYRKRDIFLFGEYDVGTWRQLDDGKIVLTSERRFHDISCGPFSLFVRDAGGLERLKELPKRIRSFLNVNKSETFRKKEIENIMKVVWNAVLVEEISVLGHVKTVKRSELERLLAEIDLYLAGDEKNTFYAIPYQYKSYKFIVFEGGSDDLDPHSDPEAVKYAIDTDPNYSQTYGIKNRAIDETAALKKFQMLPAEAKPRWELFTGQESPPTLTRGTLEVYSFPKGQAQYFLKRSKGDSCYFKFSSKGRYVKIEAGWDPGVYLWDRGTWQQLDDGRIKLVSGVHFRNIQAGPLEIHIYDKEGLYRARRLETLILDFLDKNKKDRFTLREVHGISKYVLKNGNGLFPAITSYWARTILREDLNQLAVAIRDYFKRGEYNVFYLTAYVYKSKDLVQPFLLLEDDGVNPEDVIESIDNRLDADAILLSDKESFDRWIGKK